MSDNLILCGLPGVGKTQVGTHLASLLGKQYVDTDQRLELYYKTSSGNFLTCRELHRKVGEQEFRKLENQMLLTLQSLKNSIVSTGGGTLNYPDNIRLLKGLGKFVYLKGEVSLVFERLIKKGLPSYLDPQNPYSSFVKLADQRKAIYESEADITFPIEQHSPEEIAKELIKLIYGDSNGR